LFVTGTLLAFTNARSYQRTIERTLVGEWCDSDKSEGVPNQYGITEFYSDGTIIGVDYEIIKGKKCKKISRGTYTVNGKHIDFLFQGDSQLIGVHYTVSTTKNDTILNIYPDFLPMAGIHLYLINDKRRQIINQLENNLDSVILK
jgi:hypothetical protein